FGPGKCGAVRTPPELIDGSEWFHTAMCDLHHRPVGYPTGERTIRVRLIVASGHQFSPQRCMYGIQQSGPGKRLFEERYAALQHFAFRDQFTGVPRHVYDFQVRARGAQAINQFWTAHAAHHHVGQQQVNWIRMRLHPFERGLAVIRVDDRIAVFLEDLSRQAAHSFIVFHEEDRSPLPFWSDGLHFRLGFEPDFVIGGREIYLERRSVSGFTVDQDVSRALLDNAIYSGQAQTRSFAHFFGGKEGFEDARHGSFVHAVAGIADREHDVFSGCHGLMLLGEGLIESCGASFENELAAVRHSVARVHRQVYQDLVQLARVCLDHRRG